MCRAHSHVPRLDPRIRESFTLGEAEALTRAASEVASILEQVIKGSPSSIMGGGASPRVHATLACGDSWSLRIRSPAMQRKPQPIATAPHPSLFE